MGLRKAFDTFNHEILLYKLIPTYGFGAGVALSWFKDYLSNRKQYVFHNGISSNLLPKSQLNVDSHKAQSLGPFFSLIYQ